MYTRYLTMGRWDAAGDGSGGIRATVELSVVQTETGALRDWRVYLGGNGLDGATAEQARQLAAALLDAAAALEAGRSHRSEPEA